MDSIWRVEVEGVLLRVARGEAGPIEAQRLRAWFEKLSGQVDTLRAAALVAESSHSQPGQGAGGAVGESGGA